jgi:Fe-S cluster assembly iron-binding protein IscA
VNEMTSVNYNTDPNENANMIEVTSRAINLLKDFFKDSQIKPVRIFVKLGGCGIRSFGVALEEPKKQDVVIKVHDFTFIIDKCVWNQVKPIKIDADSIAFRISGKGIQAVSGCGTCGYMCGVNGSGRCTGDCLNCRLPCTRGKRLRAEKRKNQTASLPGGGPM